MSFERIVKMTAAYDKRSPDPGKNYGIHGVDLIMILRGPLGAVQFVLYTGMHWLDGVHRPLPADLGYHSPKPRYEGQAAMAEDCQYLPGGGKCFYDGSGLNAVDVYNVLLHEGSDGVWRELGKFYASIFEEEKPS